MTKQRRGCPRLLYNPAIYICTIFLHLIALYLYYSLTIKSVNINNFIEIKLEIELEIRIGTIGLIIPILILSWRFYHWKITYEASCAF